MASEKQSSAGAYDSIKFICDETNNSIRTLSTQSYRYINEVTSSMQVIKTHNEARWESIETYVQKMDVQHRDETEKTALSLQNLQNYSKNQQHSIEVMGTSVLSSLQDVKTSLQTLEKLYEKPNLDRPPYTKRASRPSLSPESNLFQSATKIQIDTSVYQTTECSSLCFCQCHKVTRFKLPPSVARFTGSLFVGYSGIPLTTRPDCTEKNCKKADSGLVKISYYFPTYLPWASRMLSIMDQWNSLDGHQLMIQGIQTLFTQKRASIYDVSSGEGRSVMHYALTGGQPNVVYFLLSQRANVNIEDKFALSPLDVLWNYLLEDPEDPLTQALRIPFESFLDETEDFQKRAFSPLHPIIFGLSKIDLASYLELSTDHIDDVCSLGRTPLCWAALRKSPEPVKTLIKFGASIDIADWRGQSPFHFSAETGNFLSLRILLRTTVRMKDKNSRIDPAKIETLYGEDDDQDNVRLPAVGRFCHDLIGARDYKGRSVLHFATRINRVSHAGLLIRYGADLDSTEYRLHPSLSAANKHILEPPRCHTLAS